MASPFTVRTDFASCCGVSARADPCREGHLSHRCNWLRAANAGILSTATLGVVRGGVGASGAAIVTAARAGLVGGARSIGAGG